MSLDSIPQRPVSIPYKKNPDSIDSKIYELLQQLPGLDPTLSHVQKIDQESIQFIKDSIQKNLNEKQKLQSDMGLYNTLINNFNLSYRNSTSFSIRFKVLNLKNHLWLKHHNMETIKEKMPVHYESIQKFLRDMSSKGWTINTSLSEGSRSEADTDGSECTFDKDFVRITFSW